MHSGKVLFLNSYRNLQVEFPNGLFEALTHGEKTLNKSKVRGFKNAFIIRQLSIFNVVINPKFMG